MTPKPLNLTAAHPCGVVSSREWSDGMSESNHKTGCMIYTIVGYKHGEAVYGGCTCHLIVEITRLTAERDAAVAERDALANPAIGDITSQAAAWVATYRALREIGIESFFEPSGMGRNRAVKFVRHIGDRLAKLERVAEAAQRYVTARNENRVELFMLFGAMQQTLAALDAKEPPCPTAPATTPP